MRAGILLVALLAGSAAGVWEVARAQEAPAKPPAAEPAPAPSNSKSVVEALDRIIRKLRRKDGHLAVGAAAARVQEAFPKAAVMATEYLVPLGGSFLDPGSTVHGSIRWSFETKEPDARLDEIQVVLLTGDAEHLDLLRAMKAAGKAVGLNFEQDDDDPGTWWDPDAEDVDIWVAFGKGIVAIDASLQD